VTLKAHYTWVTLPCCCCGSTSYKLLGYRGGAAHRNRIGIKTDIVRCSFCGHIYPRPMPVPDDIDMLYSDTEDYFSRNNPDKKIQVCDLLVDRLEKHLGYVGRLLDIGSGRGEMLYAAKKRGWDCCGVETCKEFADQSRSTYGVEVKNSPLENCHFPNNHFDAVILNVVIEHLHYPQKILSEINRISKDGTLLWIETSNEASLYHLIGNLYYRIIGKNWVTQLSPTFSPYHVQGFTKNSIKTLLSKTGFHIEYLRLYPGKAILPYSGFKEFVEYLGVTIVRSASKIFDMGRIVKVEARKVKAISI